MLGKNSNSSIFAPLASPATSPLLVIIYWQQMPGILVALTLCPCGVAEIKREFFIRDKKKEGKKFFGDPSQNFSSSAR